MKKLIILLSIILMASWIGNADALKKPCSQPGCDDHDGDFTFNDDVAVSGSIILQDKTLETTSMQALERPTGVTVAPSAGAGLTGAQYHYYSVVTLDGDNNYSAQSAPTSCYPDGGNLQCTITWSAVTDATKYAVLRYGTPTTAAGIVIDTKTADVDSSDYTVEDDDALFTTGSVDDGAVQPRDWIVNLTTGNSCQVLTVDADTLTCDSTTATGTMGASVVYSVIRPKRAGSVSEFSTALSFIDTGIALIRNYADAARVLNSTGDICLGTRCNDVPGTLDGWFPKLRLDSNHLDTLGTMLYIRTGNPQETENNFGHRTAFLGLCEDSGAGTGSMVCLDGMVERNTTNSTAITYGFRMRYNQESGTHTPTGGDPAAAIYGMITSNTGNIVDAAALKGEIVLGASGTCTDCAGLWIRNPITGGATLTNAFGGIIEEHTTGGSNFGLWMKGERDPAVDSTAGSALVFGASKQSRIGQNGNVLHLVNKSGANAFTLSLEGQSDGAELARMSHVYVGNTDAFYLQNAQAEADNVGVSMAFLIGSSRHGVIGTEMDDAGNNGFMNFKIRTGGSLLETFRLKATKAVVLNTSLTTMPACEVGDIAIDPDGTVDLCVCTGTNTWTALSGGDCS